VVNKSLPSSRSIGDEQKRRPKIKKFDESLPFIVPVAAVRV
jgi:hypothetical protein